MVLGSPEPVPGPAPPLPVADGPEELPEGPVAPDEDPTALVAPEEPPLPVTVVPDPLGRELHAHPRAPIVIMQAKRVGRVWCVERMKR